MIGFRSLQVIAASIFMLLIYDSTGHALQSNWVGDNRVAVRLITASDTTSGNTLRAGLEFQYEPGWHGYWRTPGDAGIAPQFNWTASENLADEQVAWPAPTRLDIRGLQNSVYWGNIVLPITLHLADSRAKTNISVVVDYAACAQICVPEHARLDLGLAPGAAAPSMQAEAILKAFTAIPGRPDVSGVQLSDVHFENNGPHRYLVLSLRSKSIPFDHPDLFVEGAGAGLPPAPTVLFEDGRRTAKFSVKLPDNLVSPDTFTVTLVDGDRSFEFQVPPTAAPFSSREKSELGRGSGRVSPYWRYLLPRLS